MQKLFKKQLLMFVILVGLFVNGCAKEATARSESATRPPSIQTEFEIIDKGQTKKLIDTGAVLIDNRPAAKFNAGHIRDAVNLTFFAKGHSSNTMSRENLIQAINGRETVVFYCSGAMRARNAIVQAREWGIKADMFWYKNGFEDWRQTEPYEK